MIALCAVIADCDNWPEIELWARQRESWLRRFLRLPNGIPSPDTFERVFAKIDPWEFSTCFCCWVQALSEMVGLPQIAIDGKTLRRSHDHASKLGALHVVNAWATEHHLTLGQVAVEGKSNEITAIPALLDLLELRGALITIDAMGCQKEIARNIVTGGRMCYHERPVAGEMTTEVCYFIGSRRMGARRYGEALRNH